MTLIVIFALIVTALISGYAGYAWGHHCGYYQGREDVIDEQGYDVYDPYRGQRAYDAQQVFDAERAYDAEQARK